VTILAGSNPHAGTTMIRRAVAIVGKAAIIAVGTAVPELAWPKSQTFDGLAALWNLRGAALERWQRIVAGSGIDKRHGVLAPEMVASMTTGQRMAAYERLAPPLAMQSARQALDRASIEPGDVTDIVVVSCTGLYAPGVDVDLISGLGLKATTRRTTIGFMGCFGAINGLRIASSLCAANPEAVTLLVCVELCSLHVRADDDVQNQVASALFADGAASAVLVGSRAAQRLETTPKASFPHSGGLPAWIGSSASLLLPEGRGWMSWRITDAGFAMTLTREVPAALRRSIEAFVDDLGGGKDPTFIVHPGGPGVLDAADDALNLRGGRGIDCARRVLRTFGNMSSATALFVLEDALQQSCTTPMTMLAFGPGLTIEGLRLDGDRTRHD